jgi:SAM-dependent methyltransferase
MTSAAASFAINWWTDRHDRGYFPTMDQHRDWCVYSEPPSYLVEHVAPTRDDDVLEVGCGYGQWMHPIAPLVRSIVGVDIHPTLMDKAKEKLADRPNAQTLLCDGLTLPFPDASFSLTYCISVFQHMPRSIVHGYFREIARVLKPGGRTLLHFRFADGVGEYSQDIVQDHKGDWSVGWTEDEAIAAGEAAGLPGRAIVKDWSMLFIAQKAA